MVFSSLVFVLVFLPVHLAAYVVAPKRAKNVVLLISSLIFYAWGGPAYLVLLMLDSLIAWLTALIVEFVQNQRAKTIALLIGITLILGLLGWFKYAGFLAGISQAITGWPDHIPTIVLPIGISFYTFQLVSYMVDVKRGEVRAQTAYWKLLLYSSLFHQCIAGPIVRYATVAAQIEDRTPRGADIYAGLRRFSIGLAKKTLLANACAKVVDTLLPIGQDALATQAVSGLWIGMVFYGLQIYLDFSAYSDMAIGLGRMIGFRYLENFDHPYESTSVREFWQRWHISLGSFFRDYVYIPLGGSRVSSKVFIRNMAVVWLLTGLWHGANWNYILWGAYYLGFLLLERFVIRDRMPKAFAHLYLLVIVLFGWVLFKFENLSELGTVAAGMFFLRGVPVGGMAVSSTFMSNVFLLVISCIACTSLPSRLLGRLYELAQTNDVALKLASILEGALPALLIVLSIAAMAGASYNPFIYFQF